MDLLSKPDRAQLIANYLDEILTWAEEHPHFETDFIESLKEQFENKGDLSDKQIVALQNIAEKWDI